ncbi:MAG: SIMPL domain-containing protein [Cryobacterium sp.]|nr:SIMPL domain-containing protein [Oligoflexia bacterium]
MKKTKTARRVLFSLLGFLGCLLSARADLPRSISVLGTCAHETTPDRSRILLTVDVRKKTSGEAREGAAKIYEQIRSEVTALKLPEGEVTTSEYISEEVKEWEKNRMVSKGFHTRISLKVETRLVSRLSEVIEIGTRAGVTEMSALSFYVTEKKIRDEKLACQKEAVLNARVQAEAMALALDGKVGEVLSIADSSSPPADEPHPMMMKTLGSDRAERSAPVLEAGLSRVTATVAVVFRLK